MEESNKFYFLYDRLSPRHKWQICSGSDNEQRHYHMLQAAMKTYLNWTRKEVHPAYQLGHIIIDKCDVNDDTFQRLCNGNLSYNDERVKVVYSAMKG